MNKVVANTLHKKKNSLTYDFPVTTNEDVEPLVFDVKQSVSGDYSKTELFSMKFNEIVDTYSIPREAGREIVHLVRSIVEANECKTCDNIGNYEIQTCLIMSNALVC